MPFRALDFKNRNGPKNIALDPSDPDDKFPRSSKKQSVSDTIRFFFGDGAVATQRHKAQENWVTQRLERQFDEDFTFDKYYHRKILDTMCVELVESRPDDYANMDLNDKSKLEAARMWTRDVIIRCQTGRRRRRRDKELREGKKTSIPAVSRTRSIVSPAQSLSNYDRDVWPSFTLKHVIRRGSESEKWNLSLRYLVPAAERAQLTPLNLTEEMYESWVSKLQCRCDGVNVIEQQLIWCVEDGERTTRLLSWIDWATHILVNARQDHGEACSEIDVLTSGKKRGSEETLSSPEAKVPRIDPPNTNDNLLELSEDPHQDHSTDNRGKQNGNGSGSKGNGSGDSKNKHGSKIPDSKSRHSNNGPDTHSYTNDPFEGDLQVMLSWKPTGHDESL